ncbi:MAG TPA: iron-sulfur cluster biosynthesis family protein [Thermoplasmata archaeon]|nr:iron-sulfur cluster biosynthesis family protein [Thermoplasmata archaeon]
MSVKVEVTPEAQAQVRRLIQDQPAGTAVRLFLAEGGGCGCGEAGCGGGAGRTTFGLAFDQPGPKDSVIPVDGFSVLVDQTVASGVDGARIDFVQTLEATGFTVKVPGQAPSTPVGSGCGCGSGGSGGCC